MEPQIEPNRMPDVNREIGRVLRASTSGFSIGSRVSQLSDPSFGCLVKAQPLGQGEAIYGLIYNMNIDDDPLVRRLVLAESPSQSVIEDQRSNRLLPIEMSALAIGYRLDGEIHHGLPPRPPLNLDPVVLCQDAVEVERFTEKPGYLRLVLRAGAVEAVDQLLVAHVRQIYELRDRDADWVLSTVQELIDMLRGDYDLLLPTLKALGEAIPNLGQGSLAPDFGLL